MPVENRCAAVLLIAVMASPLRAEEVVVFAAASMKGPLDAVAAAFHASTGHDVTISYGGSNALARQIIQGAPADIFISAAPVWMDEVEKAGLVMAGTRRDILGNALVLIAHDPAAARVTLGPDLDLSGLLGGGKLSMAAVDTVPAGQYGKSALEHLGLWETVRADVVQSDNVRAALAFVALGEAPFGIVYATDAAAQPGVSVVARFSPDSHPAILYPAAVLSGAANAADLAFHQALLSDPADAIFAAAGFQVLD